MAARTIVIGDVHGCSDELADLLAVLKPAKQDRLISVGDLVSKGPDSRGVLDWAMSAPNLETVVGNHELRLLEAWKRGKRAHGKPYDEAVYEQLGSDLDTYMRWAAGMPSTLSGPGFLVVHAGFDPREGLEWQSRKELTSIRRLEDGRPWFEAYRERALVVFGHWAQRRPIVRANAIGLDTGCVYGGELTALILPERRLVSVPARRAYVEKKTWDEPQLAGVR
jgi:diadenosine tetraphosphatase ApaH/serine/threonine PP2A family protein phosphatase